MINAIQKSLMLAILVIAALFASVFATPITVSSMNVQEQNGDYVVLVTLANADVASGKFDELSFAISELGTSKNIGVVTVDSSSKTFTYNLRELTDSYSLLKKGSTYTLSVSTAVDSESQAFLFGSERSTEGLGLIVETIRINDEVVTDTDVLSIMNGETLNVDLRFSALENFDDARVMVFIEGYEHSPIIASTPIFSVIEGKTYVKTVSINLPADMDNQKDYKLRITGANDLSGITYKDYTLYVDTQRHRVDIIDLVMTPSSGVEPGQNLIGNVRLKNRGQKSQDSVKVHVTIPELNIAEASYVSNLNTDEVVTSDDMLLFIPEEAKAGEYEVLVKLAYADGYTTSTESFKINVLSPRLVSEKNLLVSFENNQDLVAGRENTFEVVIANPNTESKPISLAVLEQNWADVQISPSLAMVKGGESATFTVKVAPKDAIAGEKELLLLVKEGSTTISELKVNTYVEGKTEINWVNVALAVLLIIAIIILLALVITITRRRKDENGEEPSSTEEYY